MILVQQIVLVLDSLIKTAAHYSKIGSILLWPRYLTNLTFSTVARAVGKPLAEQLGSKLELCN